MRLLVISLVILGSIHYSTAQNTRLNTYETIGWYNYFGTFRFSQKLGLHSEYQWRRDNVIKYWQQSLLRVGVNYHMNERVLFRAGYGWIETFPYGEYSINSMGKSFTEHRIFEMVQLTHKEDRVEFSHRFMLEQRFVGRYTTPELEEEDEFPLLNRIRYMIRLQVPLKGKEIADRTPYIALYDEVFIGFGKNVTANVFDQNRIGALMGYRFNKTFRLEAGYIHQKVQFGRLINGRNVFQENNGIIINMNFNMDFSQKTN